MEQESLTTSEIDRLWQEVWDGTPEAMSRVPQGPEAAQLRARFVQMQENPEPGITYGMPVTLDDDDGSYLKDLWFMPGCEPEGWVPPPGWAEAEGDRVVDENNLSEEDKLWRKAAEDDEW